MDTKRWLIYCPDTDKPTMVYTRGDQDMLDALVKYHGSGLYTLVACTIWGHYAIETPYSASNDLDITPVLQCPHPKKGDINDPT